MYVFTLAEVIGKIPGRFVEIIPFISSNFIAFTPMECFLSRLPRAGSIGGSCSISSLMIYFFVVFVDGLIPFLIRRMWTMIVIGNFGRCSRTAVVVNIGQLMNH